MRSSWIIAVAICALGGVAGVAAAGPRAVGTVEPLSVRSEAMAAAGAFATRDGWQLEIHHPGATYIALHFAQFDLPGGEWVRISDPVGGQSSTLVGRGKMGAGRFWARHVKGDRAVIEFSTRRAAARGFEIDRYAAGFESIGFEQEATCGLDDKQNAVCYEDSHPTEYDRSRAVARLLVQGTLTCTGWLASAESHLITNEHCLTNANDTLNTDFEFMAETDSCGEVSCRLCHPGAVFSGASFIEDDVDLDYALVQIPTGDPASTYGYLQIDDRDAITGERIYIPQHPGGFAKQIAIESSDPGDPGWCEVDGFTEACTGTGYLDVGYQCDTKSGSSGSPVIAASSHRVIALHHCADCLNRAVPINLIYDRIGQLIDPEMCMLGVDDLLLENDTVLGSETQQSCKTVTAGSNYAVASGADLTMRTRSRVVLRAGTSVAPGGLLRVQLDPLTGAP